MNPAHEHAHPLTRVVAVGASAGGVEALTSFAGGLPPDLPYAVMVTLHMPAVAQSALARILDRAGPLPAAAAVHGEQVEPGRIYVAVPNHHLLLLHGRVVVSQGPSENGHRPAINALFRSVALACGQRAVGILLSGVLDDGVLGLAAIRSRGGATLVQQPADAHFPDMPCHAIEAGVVDTEAPAAELGRVLTELASSRTEGEADLTPDVRMELENRIALAGHFPTFDAEELGPPSGYSCPDCGGNLLGVEHGNYRCRVGHAWTTDALLRARDNDVERALWTAIRSLQEKASLARKLAARLGSAGGGAHYVGTAAEAEGAMNTLIEHLAPIPPPGGQLDE